MSAEIEGAINSLTAAVLALAVQVEKGNDVDASTAQQNVEYSYDKCRRYILDHD